MVTEQDVEKLVRKSKTTSCQLDPISTKLVKEHLGALLPVLTHIINSSLLAGVFPDLWKTALVIPLLKKRGAELIYKNYRPVSNLQYVSKLTERAVVNQLCAHSDLSYPLPSCQSAYRVGHSTETALVKVMSDMLLDMDQQKVTQLVMIDLSSAFDTVSHSVLLDIMEKSFGVSGVPLHWLESYLTSRSQCVIIQSTRSAPCELNTGVPQGSCLGPVLFTQYASPVFELIEDHDKSGHGYADDHQIYNSFSPEHCVQNISSMERCISSIREWMSSMKLRMNDSKTEYILIGTQHQLAKCSKSSISIGDCTIEASGVVRNLGAYFDKNLSMDYHVKMKCRAAYAQLFMISKIRNYLDEKSAEQLIHALVHSHIDYCSAILIGLPKCLLNKLQMVQNSAARVLCRVKKRDTIKPTLKRLHWLSVASRIKFKVCCLTFKALHDQGPQYLKEMLVIRNTGLRSSNTMTLNVPRTRSKSGDRSFAVAAPREWNLLPVDIRTCDNFETFRRKLKHHYFQMDYD